LDAEVTVLDARLWGAPGAPFGVESEEAAEKLV
jgi:hypothetical protein